MLQKYLVKAAAYAVIASVASTGAAFSADYSMSVGMSSYDYGLRIQTTELSDFSFDGEQYEFSLQRATEDYTLSVKHTFSDPVDIASAAEKSASPVGETLYMSQEETSISIQRPVNEMVSWFAGYYRSQLEGKGHNDGNDGNFYNEFYNWLETSGLFVGLSAQKQVSDRLVLFGRGAFQTLNADLYLASNERLNPNVQYQTALGSGAYGIDGSATLIGFGLAYPLQSGATLVLSYEAKDFDFDDFNLRGNQSSIDFDWDTIGLSINFAL